ncbi:hypothetical protein [Paracoccus yeei]|uniref:Phage terminase large subunit family protein n=1 Tax=Paracoccus yeei TaxID=147645 RepID=A0A386UJP1_9RHOB|nr:phage terminase large subunit family protein [Paracoccus yeei]
MNFASFEGAEDIAVAWARGLAPDPAQTVAEWADRHRILSSRAASEAGPYRTSRTPYLKAIMEALSPNNPAHQGSRSGQGSSAWSVLRIGQAGAAAGGAAAGHRRWDQRISASKLG